LIDPFNHTGYAQVLKSDDGANVTVYAIGHDVIGQAAGTAQNALKFFVYDGHGSVRHLADNTGALISGQNFNYDAYGNRKDSASAQTNLLYSGEWYDNVTLQYYLRARWYSPATGRFNTMDPFAGNNQDPQSLHKYLYAHCNPINSSDPSGTYSFGEMVCVAGIIGCLSGIIAGEVIRIKGGTEQQIIDAQCRFTNGNKVCAGCF
jgi:RHS repeat-associated protein